jgi:hypothetical protein
MIGLMWEFISDMVTNSINTASLFFSYFFLSVEDGSFRHLDFYVNELKTLLQKYCKLDCPLAKVKQIPVFVMTDDQSELEQTSKYPEFEWIYLKTFRHEGGRANFMFTEEQAKNKMEIYYVLATEWSIMSNAEFFVGTEG